MSDRKTGTGRPLLVGRMADAVGADMLGAALDGQAPEPLLRTAIAQCLRCTDKITCAAWLEARPPGPGTAACPPDYCRNKALLTRIAAAQGPAHAQPL